jgi:hypothetical protein
VSRFFAGGASTDSVNCGALDDVLLENQPLTICIWLNQFGLGAGAGNSRIISRGLNNSNGFDLRADQGGGANGALYFAITGGTELNRVGTNTDVVYNIWQFWIVTHTGSSIATDIHMYKNLLEVNYSAKQDGVSPSDNSNTSLIIGNTANLIRPYYGLMAYLQIFNRVISGNEFIRTMVYPGSVTNGLKRLYLLSGVGSFEGDYSGNRQHGAVTGTKFFNSGPPINGIYLPRGFSRHAYVVPAAAPAPAIVSTGRKITRNLVGVGL